MIRRGIRSPFVGLAAGALLVSLTGCTQGESIAYNVTGTEVDVAFCETFTATSVKFDFGKYPPPFMGSLYTIGILKWEGELVEVVAGVPISEAIAGWTQTHADEIPSDWARVDISFHDAGGSYVEGVHLFSREVTTSEWAWTTGLNMAPPQCELVVSN